MPHVPAPGNPRPRPEAAPIFSVRKFFEHPCAAATLGLVAATQGSEVMRDICVAQSTDACLHGQTPIAALTGLAAAIAVPQLIEPSRHAAQKRWHAHSRSVAKDALKKARAQGHVSSGAWRSSDAQKIRVSELRQSVAHSVRLTTEAAEGLCMLVAQKCILGASPVGQSIAGSLITLAVAAVMLSNRADTPKTSPRAAKDPDATAYAEFCEQLWEDDGDTPGHATRVAACTEHMAQLSKTLQRRESVKLGNLMVGHLLGVLPAAVGISAVLMSHAGAAASFVQTAHTVPPVVDSVEEWRLLLHLAVWLPVAAHHVACSRRLLRSLNARTMAQQKLLK